MPIRPQPIHSTMPWEEQHSQSLSWLKNKKHFSSLQHRKAFPFFIFQLHSKAWNRYRKSRDVGTVSTNKVKLNTCLVLEQLNRSPKLFSLQGVYILTCKMSEKECQVLITATNALQCSHLRTASSSDSKPGLFTSHLLKWKTANKSLQLSLENEQSWIKLIIIIGK